MSRVVSSEAQDSQILAFSLSGQQTGLKDEKVKIGNCKLHDTDIIQWIGGQLPKQDQTGHSLP